MNTFTLQLTTDQLKVLDEAIGQLPYRVAAPLVGAINEQLSAQQQPAPTDDLDQTGGDDPLLHDPT